MDRARAKLPLWREVIWMVPGTFALMLFAGFPTALLVAWLATAPGRIACAPARQPWATALEQHLLLPVEATAGLTVAAVVAASIAWLWWRDRHEAAEGA